MPTAMLWISQTAKYQNSSVIGYHQHLANLATMDQANSTLMMLTCRDSIVIVLTKFVHMC